MSTWTHVAATIRIDDLRVFEDGSVPDLGKTVSFDDPPEAWEACTVPKGSEGSLQHQLWVNPNVSSMAAYTATIWGDLRDYENLDEIVAYLSRLTSGRLVRLGAAVIEAGPRQPVVLRYDADLGTWVGREGNGDERAYTPEPNRFLKQLLADNGYLTGRVLSDRWVFAVRREAYLTALVLCEVGDTTGCSDRWDYETPAAAVQGMFSCDGKSEPTGWFRNPRTGRRVSRSPDEYDQDDKRVGAVGVVYIRR